jgi:hypothetical protein
MESRAKKQHRRTFQGCKKVRVDILEIKKGVMMKKLIIENEQEPFETDKEYKKRIKEEGEQLYVTEGGVVAMKKKLKKVL